jgi:hypothetical protein
MLVSTENSRTPDWIARYPKVLRLAGTVPGKMALAVIFGCLCHLAGSSVSLETSLSILVISLLPRYRRPLVSLATLYLVWVQGVLQWRIYPLAAHMRAYFVEAYWYVPVLMVVAMVAGLLALARRFPSSRLMRRPVRNLLLAYLGILLLASYAPRSPWVTLGLWLLVAILGKLLWFLAYSLHDAKRGDRTPFRLQLGHYVPFWGSSNVPFPKGETFLQRIEVKTPQALAECQLSGVRLMAWAVVLSLILRVLDRVAYGDASPGDLGALAAWVSFDLQLPPLHRAIDHFARAVPYGWATNWLAVIVSFNRTVLSLAVFGHAVVATCRMAGFRAPANTDRPFASTTIAEFYNRLYYYFKELLVDFFFYPAFFRTARLRPQLRMFVATICAAGFGNALYHYLRDFEVIFALGPWRALVTFQVYLLYCAILGVAIGFSQLRAMSRNGQRPMTRPRRLLGSAGVGTFYCLVMIMDDPPRYLTVADYAGFVASLFLPFWR